MEFLEKVMKETVESFRDASTHVAIINAVCCSGKSNFAPTMGLIAKVGWEALHPRSSSEIGEMHPYVILVL